MEMGIITKDNKIVVIQKITITTESTSINILALFKLLMSSNIHGYILEYRAPCPTEYNQENFPFHFKAAHDQ